MVIGLGLSSEMAGATQDEERAYLLGTSTLPSVGESYVYDAQDRLYVYATSGTHSFSQHFQLDALGNRISLNDGGAQWSYQYVEDNRLSQYYRSGLTVSLQYDANGNLLIKDTGSSCIFKYDYEDRLIEVRKDGTVQATYVYDGLGRRIKATESGTATYTLYQGIIRTHDWTSTTQTDYIYANGLLIARIAGSTVNYFHSDALGSTRLVTDASANIVFETHYRPFGLEYGTSGSDPSFKYTGQKKDATGLYYLNARHYDPETGRFIQQDPVLGRLRDPQSLNRYSYVGNNPTARTDSTGRFWNVVIGAVAGGVIGYGACVVMTGGWTSAECGKAAAVGIVAGAVAGATFNPAAFAGISTALGGGFLGGVIAAGTAGAVSGAAAGIASYVFEGSMKTITGEGFEWSVEGALTSTLLGAAGGFAGGAAGYAAGNIASRLLSRALSEQYSLAQARLLGQFFRWAEKGKPPLSTRIGIVGIETGRNLLEEAVGEATENAIRNLLNPGYSQGGQSAVFSGTMGIGTTAPVQVMSLEMTSILPWYQ